MGHPTFDLNLAHLIADQTPNSSDDEQDELAVLSQDYSFFSAGHSDGVDDLAALRTQLPGQLLPSPPSPVLTALLLPNVDDDNVSNAVANNISEHQEAALEPEGPGEEMRELRFMLAPAHC